MGLATGVLGDEEIRFVMQSETQAGPTLRFLLATGLRLGEAYEGSRDGQHWIVPAEASKNGKEHWGAARHGSDLDLDRLQH
jgi:hypothetical protein